MNKMRLGEKSGSGVGATIDFYHNATGEKIGTIAFHCGNSWQVTDSSKLSRFSWDTFYAAALQEARKNHPQG